MDYTVYTKDTTYKADLLSAIGKNVGPNFDFVPPEQYGWEANDDQVREQVRISPISHCCLTYV